MTALSGERARFLFREDFGIIDAATWRFHAGWLVALLGVLTLLIVPLVPFMRHDLSRQPFFAPMTIVANTYVISYSFAVLVIAISYVMLSIKRLRDRARPTAFAGLVPFLAFVAASVHFLQPIAADAISIWYVVILDALLAVAVVVTVIELGFRPSA